MQILTWIFLFFAIESKGGNYSTAIFCLVLNTNLINLTVILLKQVTKNSENSQRKEIYLQKLINFIQFYNLK